MDYAPLIYPSSGPGAIDGIVAILALISFLGLLIASVFSSSQPLSVTFGLLAAFVIVGFFVGFSIRTSSDATQWRDARLAFTQERIDQIDDVYGVKLDSKQFADLSYPYAEKPGKKAELFGETRILADGKDLAARTITLAWNGKELVLLGNAEGSDLQELPRLAHEKPSWAAAESD